MYSVFDYGMMLADARADRYAAALRASVRPGAVVVDLGTGTGVWACYACALGAARVVAIEPDDVIEVAREVARTNGFLDRITFIQQPSQQVTLDQPADVVVADVRGVLPLAGRSLATMIDARRFLKPGGALIPETDSLWVAPVQAPRAHAATVDPWEKHGLGLEFSVPRRAAVNLWRKERFEASDLLGPPACWSTLDYRTRTDASAGGQARVRVDKAAEGHGLAVWFESELVPGIRLSNRPGDPPMLYGQAYFPWPDRVALNVGDEVDVRLRADLAGAEYFFTWETIVRQAGTGAELARFVQSTFAATPMSAAVLRAHAADAIVAPGPETAIERIVLDALDGCRTQAEVAGILLGRFPHVFTTLKDALARVAEISARAIRHGGEVTFRE